MSDHKRRDPTEVVAGALIAVVLLAVVAHLSQTKQAILDRNATVASIESARRAAPAVPLPAGGAVVPDGTALAGGSSMNPDAALTGSDPSPVTPVPSPAVPAPFRAASPVLQPPPVAPAGPPPVRQPSAGDWHYVVQVGSADPDPVTLTVTPSTRGRDVEVLHNAQASHSESHAWSGSEVRTTRTVTSSGSCVWEPAQLTLELPLRSKQTWSARTACTSSDGVRTDALVRTAVKGWTNLDVDGRKVPTWVLSRQTQLAFSKGGVTERTSATALDYFAPGLGVVVLHTERATYVDKDGQQQTVASAQRLVRLTPS
jgi:hypothetical protein